MEERKDFIPNNKSVERDEVFSKAVRAGKRTYFFDVKATRKNEYYITITESKKRFNKEGHQYYEKHKLFLYKEDFEKFQDGFSEVLEFIQKSNATEHSEPASFEEAPQEEKNNYTDIEFEDLEVEVTAEEASEE